MAGLDNLIYKFIDEQEDDLDPLSRFVTKEALKLQLESNPLYDPVKAKTNIRRQVPNLCKIWAVPSRPIPYGKSSISKVSVCYCSDPSAAQKIIDSVPSVSDKKYNWSYTIESVVIDDLTRDQVKTIMESLNMPPRTFPYDNEMNSLLGI